MCTEKAYRQCLRHHLCSSVTQCLAEVIEVFQVCLSMNNKDIDVIRPQSAVSDTSTNNFLYMKYEKVKVIHSRYKYLGRN